MDRYRRKKRSKRKIVEEEVERREIEVEEDRQRFPLSKEQLEGQVKEVACHRKVKEREQLEELELVEEEQVVEKSIDHRRG